MSLRASLLHGQVKLGMDVAYDQRGTITLAGGNHHLVSWVADQLGSSTGFRGHLVDYPESTPRDVHVSLLSNAAAWVVTDLLVDDVAPAPPIPEGAVS